MNFIFFVYLVGLIIAVFQDFKRREIDDWLNVFLLFSGILFILVFGVFNLANLGLYIFICAGTSFLLCYAGIFSGGDAKLLFAISPFFYNVFFVSSMINFGTFVLLLFLAGSAYGLLYTLFLFFKNFRKAGKEFVLQIRKKYFIILLVVAFLFLLLGFYDFVFAYSSVLIFFIVILFCMAFALDKTVLVFKISTKNVGEGDMLINNLRIGARKFLALKKLTAEQADFLNGKDVMVLIKDGVPYALSFLIAFILYYFRAGLISIIF